MGLIDIDNIIEKMEEMRGFKDNVLKIIQMADDPLTSIEELTRVIELDDAMTALILKIANSAYYGGKGKIKTIHEAVVLLGFTAIKSIAIAASMMLKQEKTNEEKILPREKIWKHSLATAISSKYLAGEFNMTEPDEAYIIGLLHDIGILAIFQYDIKLYKKIYDYILEKKIATEDAEKIILGFTHAQIGALILDKWNFPDSIINTVMYHHEFIDDLKNINNIKIIILSDFIANSLGFNIYEYFKPIDKDILKRIQIDYNKLQKYIQEVSKIISHINILSIKI